MGPASNTTEERIPLVTDMELKSAETETYKGHATTYREYTDEPREAGPSTSTESQQVSALGDTNDVAPQTHRLYKRRFFGLVHLALLNIIVSWCWLTFAASSTTTSHYFEVSESGVNWLSTGFLFAFVVASPVTMWTLNRGVKPAMLVASALLLVGNWIRYAGARAGSGGKGTFGVVVFGQILIGFAQPFVLAAPTRYSDLWFSEKGRITATALASLANPFGGALGQLVGPFLATKKEEIPNLVLYVAIITTVLTIPTPFLPARPPTPPTPTSIQTPPSLSLHTLRTLFANPSFYLLALPFTIYVSAFNAISSLLNQILHPYSFSEDSAGIAGALLILVGLVAAAISSPIVDRHKSLRLPLIKVLVPIIAGMCLALVFVPGTRQLAGVYVVCAVLGAASFALLPLALELLVEVTWPVGPEVSSTVVWAAGQLGGGIFILVMDALRGGVEGEPERTMYRGLVFQAVLAWVVVPLPMLLGFWGLGRERRVARAVEVEGGG